MGAPVCTCQGVIGNAGGCSNDFTCSTHTPGLFRTPSTSTTISVKDMVLDISNLRGGLRNWINLFNTILKRSTTWTDPTLTSGTTKIRLVHFTQVNTVIDQLNAISCLCNCNRGVSGGCGCNSDSYVNYPCTCVGHTCSCQYYSGGCGDE